MNYLDETACGFGMITKKSPVNCPGSFRGTSRTFISFRFGPLDRPFPRRLRRNRRPCCRCVSGLVLAAGGRLAAGAGDGLFQRVAGEHAEQHRQAVMHADFGQGIAHRPVDVLSCLVSPRITAPRQITAAYRPLAASSPATVGISNAPAPRPRRCVLRPLRERLACRSRLPASAR